jgi:hypothetical protein
MAYKVIWKRTTIENDLASIVFRVMESGVAVEPITLAMNAIEDRLKTNPLGQGESRESIERILIVWPLSVTFEVHEEEKVALILKVRYSPGRKPQ